LASVASAQGVPDPQPGRIASTGEPQRIGHIEQVAGPRSDQFLSRDTSIPAGGNRLSPEERRQLRRDVHEAGRDLYSHRMQGGRRESRRQ
jgi:uncharacterized membrane protein